MSANKKKINKKVDNSNLLKNNYCYFSTSTH